MDLTNYFGSNILEILSLLRSSETVVDYRKIEKDEFLHVPESGYYLQSKNGTGQISDLRFFFERHEEFFPLNDRLRGKYSSIKNFSDLEKLLGQEVRVIRAMKIPEAASTLPGKQYLDGEFVVTGYSKNEETITFIHIKSK